MAWQGAHAQNWRLLTPIPKDGKARDPSDLRALNALEAQRLYWRRVVTPGGQQTFYLQVCREIAVYL